MKRVIIMLAIAGATTMFAFGQKKETRTVSDFSGIVASNVFEITVTKGSTESLIIEADDAVMPQVRSEVRNGVLNLYLDNEKSIRNIKVLKANVVMRNLDKLSLSGASKLTSNDLFTPERFKADCSGVSNLTINVNTGELSITASGACKIQLKANVTGDAKFDVSGTSKVQSELKAANVKFNSSGVSSVDLSGSAKDFKIDVSGTSKVQADNFVVKTATIKSSGTSKITVNVTETMNINSSGTSTIEYKGSPAINANTGGASKIRKF